MAQADFFNYLPMLMWFMIFFIFFYFLNYMFMMPFMYSNMFMKSNYFYFLFNKVKNYEYSLLLDKIYVYYFKRIFNVMYFAMKQYMYILI